MPSYRCIVTWTHGAEYVVEAEDSDAARDTALEQAMAENPWADDYELAWEPEEITNDAA